MWGAYMAQAATPRGPSTSNGEGDRAVAMKVTEKATTKMIETATHSRMSEAILPAPGKIERRVRDTGMACTRGVHSTRGVRRAPHRS